MKVTWSTATTSLSNEQTDYRLSELYHENSKLFPEITRQQAAQFTASPFELYLTSRGFRQYRFAPKVPLPAMIHSSEAISDVMLGRRSSRNLAGAISFDELATILRQALGPTAAVHNKEHDTVQVLRAWPSAGGLYPIDTYVVVQAVTDLEPGIYHYNVITSELELLPTRSPQEVLCNGFFWQEFVTTAAVTLLLVAVFERTLAKYGERGYRLVLLDAGHAAQNILLTAEQLQIGAVAVAGFCDDSLAMDLGIDGISEAVVHTVVMGAGS